MYVGGGGGCRVGEGDGRVGGTRGEGGGERVCGEREGGDVREARGEMSKALNF